jgi:glutathione S-transferase
MLPCVPIALLDAKATYQLKRIDFGRTEQRSLAYLEINPKGRVPALVTPRGILTETPAILAFIAHSFPEALLLDISFRFPSRINKDELSASVATRGLLNMNRIFNE